MIPAKQPTTAGPLKMAVKKKWSQVNFLTAILPFCLTSNGKALP
jgi:hypothetical protein